MFESQIVRIDEETKKEDWLEPKQVKWDCHIATVTSSVEKPSCRF